MLDAHVEAGFMVGLPFGHAGVYDFGEHGGMTRRVSELGAVMLKHRLTPPPDESYSLHRKLSGAFLSCMKLRARVPCRQLFLEACARVRLRAGWGLGGGMGGRQRCTCWNRLAGLPAGTSALKPHTPCHPCLLSAQHDELARQEAAHSAEVVHQQHDAAAARVQPAAEQQMAA